MKNARRWNICHTPRQMSATSVNHAKFCTRFFVDTAQRGQQRKEEAEGVNALFVD